jgi:hypothetical protein
LNIWTVISGLPSAKQLNMRLVSAKIVKLLKKSATSSTSGRISGGVETMVAGAGI